MLNQTPSVLRPSDHFVETPWYTPNKLLNGSPDLEI